MLQKYDFCGEGVIEFDDTRSVRELIEYAFERFAYYEPLGMDAVTLFQPNHPGSDTGWFTTDVSRSCAEEIKKRDWLCFAYHVPNVFYFAEGGWGHHMRELGNRPMIPNEESMKIMYDNDENTVVINGSYTWRDIINRLKAVGYLDDGFVGIKVIPMGCAHHSFNISCSDPLMDKPLGEFLSTVEDMVSERCYGENLYYTVFSLD